MSAPIYDTYNTFYFTKAGQIVPTISALVSLISSSAVIYFVLRSGSKLSTTYHRIMFFLSFWDIVGSASISLTTIPMPKDTIYPFEGKKLGSFATCEAQAFLYFVGTVFAICGNVALNIFYLCSIRYKMKEERIKKFVEPVMLFFAVLLTVPVPVVLLLGNFLNPSPFESYCSFGGYPKECTNRDDVQCIRGDPNSSSIQFIRTYLYCGIFLAFGTIIVSMVLIILTVYRAETGATSVSKPKSNSMISKENPDLLEEEEEDDDVDQGEGFQLVHTRIILRQAIMYIAAFFLIWFFTLISYFMPEVWAVQIFKCIFQPLQGLFNALIFVYHKVYNIRRSNKDLTFQEALFVLRTAPSQVPEVLLSRIDLVSTQMNNYNAGEEIESCSDDLSPSMLSPYSGNSLNTPSLPSVDLSNAISSTGISYASNKDESCIGVRKYYINNYTLEPSEAKSIEQRISIDDDESLEGDEEEESMASNS